MDGAMAVYPGACPKVGGRTMEETLRCGPLRVGETGCGPLQGCLRGAGKRLVLSGRRRSGAGDRGWGAGRSLEAIVQFPRNSAHR